MTALTPVYTRRLADRRAAPRARGADSAPGAGADDRAARARSASRTPERRADDYPHQFSGGMRQRVMIAMALSCNPSLLIADEPTTALDVTIQAQILELMKRLQRDHRLVDHPDHARHGRRRRPRRAGRRHVRGPRRRGGPEARSSSAIRSTRTPGACSARSRASTGRALRRLAAIPGAPPVSARACRRAVAFAPRCPHRFDRCSTRPELLERVAPGQQGRVPSRSCRAAGARAAARRSLGARSATTPDAPAAARGASRSSSTSRCARPRSASGRATTSTPSTASRSTCGAARRSGVVGESGCGKSTLGRLLVRLHEPTGGTVPFDGADITTLSRARAAAVPPRDADDLPGPLRVAQPAQARRRRSSATRSSIHGVGSTRRDPSGACRSCSRSSACRRTTSTAIPHEFSGGQRQRIGVARALALNPQLIVADEPVSALDVSIQAQVVNLLDDLQDEFGLTYVFIAHDLGVVRHVSDRIAVMYLGVIVEIAPADELYERPIHPYTEALLSAIPAIDDRRRTRPPASGSCSRARCRARSTRRPAAGSIRAAAYATEICRSSDPPLADFGRARWPPATTRSAATPRHPGTRPEEDAE